MILICVIIEVLVLVVIHNTRTLVYTEFVYYENK